MAEVQELERNDTDLSAMRTTVHDVEISMPHDEAHLLAKHYAKRKNILEFGSGGSTELALKLGAERVVSVESDKAWADNLRDRLSKTYDPDRFSIHYEDIGPTVKWGRPRDAKAFRKFPNYPLAVWDTFDGWKPDVILIDGRFRVGCLYGALLNITRKTTILFDDYENRSKYHCIEKYVGKPEIVGRMAVIDGRALKFKKEFLTEFARYFVNPN